MARVAFGGNRRARLIVAVFVGGDARHVDVHRSRRQRSEIARARVGDDHRRHAADRERAAAGSRDQEGLLRSARGSRSRKRTLQSGNDVVLALANGNGDIGYLGYVPMMIGRTQGIPFTAVAASEVEGTSELDNWQNIIVSGNSSIRTPRTSPARRSPSTRSRASAR